MSEPARKRRGPITLFCESQRFRRAAILAIVVLPATYVLSSGPACWLTAIGGEERYRALAWREAPPIPSAMLIYLPLGRWLSDNDSWPARLVRWWMAVGAPARHSIRVPCEFNTRRWLLWDREWAPFPF